MPLDIVGKHAEEEMGSYVILGTMPYGADKKFDSFEGPEDAFYLGELLIASYGVLCGESFGSFTGTDHIDAVKGFFPRDRHGVPGKCKETIFNSKGKVCGHLEAVHDRACFAKGCLCSSGNSADNAGEGLLRGVEQAISFPFFCKVGVEAGDEPFSG